MSSDFTLELRTPDGKLPLIVPFSNLKISRSVSKPDVLVFTTLASNSIFDGYRLTDFIDHRIVVYDNLLYENTFLIRGVWKRKGLFEILAVDPRDFLRRRIIAYASGTSQSSKTAALDNIFKAVVRENLGSSAAAIRQIQGLAVSADVGAGPSITKSFAWKNILEVFYELQLSSAAQNNEVFYWISPTPTGWLFETKVGRWGSDLSVVKNLKLSEGDTALDIFEEWFDASEEANYAYAGGQNVGTARDIQEVSTIRTGSTIYNRCEAFVNATAETTAAGLQATGYEKLGEQTPKLSLSGEIHDTKLFRYHKDWNLGDQFLVQTSLQVAKVQVRNVVISSDGISDTITAKIEG